MCGPSGAPLRAVVALVGLLALVTGAWGIYISGTAAFGSDDVAFFAVFGFGDNATARVQLSLLNSSVSTDDSIALVVCDLSAYSQLAYASDRGKASFCRGLQPVPEGCVGTQLSRQDLLVSQMTPYKWNVTFSKFNDGTKQPRPGEYYLGGLNCSSDNLVMSYDGHLTQADGDNLSTTDLPMPLITLTFVVLWVSTTASAFAFIFWHHDRRRVYLHWGFVATSAGYVGNFTLRHAYWQILSSRGLVPGGVAEGAGLVTVLVYTLLFSTILLICKGLSLTRGYLRNYEWTLMALMMSYIFAVMAGIEFIGNDSFLLYIVYLLFIVLMGVLIHGVNRNTRFLRACQRLVVLVEQQNHGRADPAVLRTLPVLAKYAMYRALLAILCIYTASRFVRQFAIVFQTQEPWLARLLQDIFDYLLLTSCMFVFRPRMNPAVFPPRDILMELPTFEAFFQQPRLGVDLVGELDDTRIRESINMILSQQRRERMEGAGGEGEGEGDGDDVPLYLGVVLPHAGTDDAGEWMRAAVEVREVKEKPNEGGGEGGEEGGTGEREGRARQPSEAPTATAREHRESGVVVIGPGDVVEMSSTSRSAGASAGQRSRGAGGREARRAAMAAATAGRRGMARGGGGHGTGQGRWRGRCPERWCRTTAGARRRRGRGRARAWCRGGTLGTWSESAGLAVHRDPSEAPAASPVVDTCHVRAVFRGFAIPCTVLVSIRRVPPVHCQSCTLARLFCHLGPSRLHLRFQSRSYRALRTSSRPAEAPGARREGCKDAARRAIGRGGQGGPEAASSVLRLAATHRKGRTSD